MSIDHSEVVPWTSVRDVSAGMVSLLNAVSSSETLETTAKKQAALTLLRQVCHILYKELLCIDM
jgi:hypothetical protein